MKTSNYTESEKLTLFLDGELDPTLENEVLESISRSEELQIQYAQENAINSVVRAEGETAPPPFLKDEIFAELGYKSKPAAAVPFINWRNIWVAAGLLLVTGVSIVLLNITPAEEITSKAMTNIEATEFENKIAANTETDNNIENSSLEDVTVISAEKPAKVKSEKSNSVKPYLPDTKEDNTASVSEYGEIEEDDTAEVTSSVGKAVAAVAEKPILNTLFSAEIAGVSTSIFDFSNLMSNTFDLTDRSRMLPQFRVKDGFKNEIRIKGMNFFAPNNMMTNGGFAASYMRTLDYNLKVGLELGLENIDKVTYNADTETFGSPENVFASSLSAVARYEMKSINYYNCHPFAQVQGGIGLNSDYVYGACAGIQYSSYYMPFALQVSYDYKAFNYDYGGTSANKEKFEKQGFAIGLIYKF